MISNNETIQTDVLIVGAGPAGLATAIHLAEILKQRGRNQRIMIIEKGSSVGSHILSGALVKPSVFKELLSDSDYAEIPFITKVRKDRTVLLSEKRSLKLPFHAPYMSNKGNYIASLGQICKFLASKAEKKGVEIYPGFAVDELLYKGDKVIGAKTKDTGVDHEGKQLENYQPGTRIEARITILAEGSRGSLTKSLIKKYKLDKDSNPQIYSLGCKELWSVPEKNIKPGETYHTMGFPFKHEEFGGGFIYGLTENRVAIGLVVGLDYHDPGYDIHRALQMWKTSAFVSKFLKGGKLLEYGAKTLPEGGYYSIPKLYVDNALIVGDSAGLISMPALKGIHLAVKSGMLAAETAADALSIMDTSENILQKYQLSLNKSIIGKELYPVRNFRESFSKGLILGGIRFGTQLITGGAGFSGRLIPHEDFQRTHKMSDYKNKPFLERFSNKQEYDKTLTFDKETDIFYSGVHHDEQQKCHLLIKDREEFTAINIEQYGAPCQYFCPAEVYELHVDKTGKKEIRIHAENCLHCKTCDIKSPEGRITWTVPNGDNGPEYQNM